MAIFQLCLLALLSVAFAEGSYVFFNQLSFLGGDFNVSYNFNASSDTLEFLVEVRATGWVGFGFAVNAPNSMTNYDVAVGGVFNGSGYLKDYFTQGFGQPPEDTQQDWTLKNATEMNGITALKFCRQRNTNDSKDVAIEPGMPIFLILAYHATADVSVGSFPKHTTRSSQQVILIPAVTTTMTPMAATSTSAMAVSMKTSVRTDAPVSDIPAVVGTSTTIATEMSSSTKGKSTTTTMDPSTASAIAPTMAASYVAASAVSVPPTSTPTAVSNFISLDGGKYNVSWMFNSTMDTFHFVVKVRATGWIGFGLATRAPNGMSGYDVAVSGTNNGTKYLKDYFTGGFAAPPQDAQQDWMLSYFSEEQNVTTLKFYRKRDTNDTENDIAIQPGQSYYFIWAYHISDTVTQGRFPKHSLSGSHQVGPLIPSIQPTSIATTESPVTASAVSVPPTSTPTAVSNFISLDGGKYNVSWMFNSTMDTFHFVVKVRATGWIGFGLATRAPNGMSGYDVAVSGTNNGTKYLKDYFTGGFAAPPQDAQQDWMLSYFSEEQNVTTLKFYRKRDTNDTENDIAIQPGQSYYFIWAYHISDTVTQGQFPKHSFSGSYQVGPLIPSIQPTTTATTESPTTPGTALPTQMPFPFAFDDNKFLARWRFDDQADKIHVHLRVKTTGWIGFGFAQTAPNNMRDYDVIVGGFSNGRGYLSDYKTFGRTTPTLDASQDYTLLNASEAGGYTQLIFERPRDTGDENDFAFMRGSEAFIVWSYSNADISDERNFGIHSSKGWSSEKYALVSENQPIPTEAKASALYSSFAIALSIAFFHVLL